jgi:hypothetical protein
MIFDTEEELNRFLQVSNILQKQDISNQKSLGSMVRIRFTINA